MYGPFLRELRVSRAMTQEQLAKVVGISQPNLSAYEQGRRVPTLDVLNRIVVACGYQLVADGGSHAVRCPLPSAGWFPDEDVPPRLPDDPPDEAPLVTFDTPMRERVEVIAQVLEIADLVP